MSSLFPSTTRHWFTDSNQGLITSYLKLNKPALFCYKGHIWQINLVECFILFMDLWMFILFNYNNKDSSECLSWYYLGLNLSCMFTFGMDWRFLNSRFRLHPGGEIKTQTWTYRTTAAVCTVTSLTCSSLRPPHDHDHKKRLFMLLEFIPICYKQHNTDVEKLILQHLKSEQIKSFWTTCLYCNLSECCLKIACRPKKGIVVSFLWILH